MKIILEKEIKQKNIIYKYNSQRSVKRYLDAS